MALTAEQILEALRALPAAERLRVVEQVVHEAADAIWADETDADFDAFRGVVHALRAADVWRADDGQGPR